VEEVAMAGKNKVDPINAEIGNRIRLKRIQASLSQLELGERLEVTFQQVQKYEKGTNRIASTKVIQVCRTLNCSPNYLLGWGDDNPISERIEAGAMRLALKFNAVDPRARAAVMKLIEGLPVRSSPRSKSKARKSK
jgi:transcriptional regulator with XRE-family HTH domain